MGIPGEHAGPRTGCVAWDELVDLPVPAPLPQSGVSLSVQMYNRDQRLACGERCACHARMATVASVPDPCARLCHQLASCGQDLFPSCASDT